MTKENKYILKRKYKARLQSVLFYLFRVFPIRNKKIVFCTIEGTTGFMCSPKYIANELLKRNAGYELVWLVDDVTKKFPQGIKVCKNTLWNRAFHLTTAHIWVDNSRKQLEVRKRKGQKYIQTWHGKIGFKPIGLDRGASFSKLAYLVSKHDSDMIDYVLTNSKWFENVLPTGLLYEGESLRTGSPRCDVLFNAREKWQKNIREKYELSEGSKVLIYAPTFRGGSQGMQRNVETNDDYMPDFERLSKAMSKRFGGEWNILLRLHPQLTARHIMTEKVGCIQNTRVIDVSKYDDIYELLAGCDAFMTDYSSAAFDAAVMRIPVLIYVNDYHEYVRERGNMLWNLNDLPFVTAYNDDELEKGIYEFDDDVYQTGLAQMICETELFEDGCASERVVDLIENITKAEEVEKLIS